MGGNPRTVVGLVPGEVCPTRLFDLASRTSPEEDDEVHDVVQKREYWDAASKCRLSPISRSVKICWKKQPFPYLKFARRGGGCVVLNCS